MHRGEGGAARQSPHPDGPAHGTVGSGAWIAISTDDDPAERVPGTASPPEVASGSGPSRGEGGTAKDPHAVLLRLDQISTSEVRVRIWAHRDAAARAAAEKAPALLGRYDDWAPFDALLEARGDELSASLARIRRRHPGVRLPATGRLFDQLITATLEQKVTHEQARHGWRTLLRRHGERPPGPAPEWMRLPVTAAKLRLVPSWDWHTMWVQPPMARTIQRLAEREPAIRRLGTATTLATEEVNALAQRLQAVPGIGPWTVAEALQRSHGAADLPAVGDYHLAHLVGEALTGRRTDDAGMLRLLDPWQDHRQRVIRIIKLSGFSHQRFGPKLHPEDHRDR